jgi:hypothetical protein
MFTLDPFTLTCIQQHHQLHSMDTLRNLLVLGSLKVSAGTEPRQHRCKLTPLAGIPLVE